MADLTLNAEQLILLQAYDNDLPTVITDDEVENAGDTLLLFLFRELAKDGDTRRGEYIQRLKRAELQVREVREALEFDEAKTYTSQLPLRDAIWWFIENVPLDASWRSNLFFDLRARYRDKDFEGWTRVNMTGGTEAQDEEHDRFVVVDLKQLVEAGYSVERTSSDGWEARRSDWSSGATNTQWAAWALAQEHHDKTTA